jgi:hypothetical protein
MVKDMPLLNRSLVIVAEVTTVPRCSEGLRLGINSLNGSELSSAHGISWLSTSREYVRGFGRDPLYPTDDALWSLIAA